MKKAPVQFTSAAPNPGLPDVVDVSPEELREMSDKVHLVDVRRPEEYTGELGHVKGARLIVLDTIPEHVGSLPKDEPIVFICRSGGRSAQATAFALDQGFKHVYNMKGGMLLWNQLGFETES